jgi:secondary thiamine-phosphate synthase enzyme
MAGAYAPASVEKLAVKTDRRTQLLDITAAVRSAGESGPGSAVVLFVPHTTAGLVIQASGEGATRVASDIESALERLVDEGWSYEHVHEGDRNPWSHVRAALMASSLTIPLVEGKLALGDLQAVFLCEFDGPRERTVFVSVI